MNTLVEFFKGLPVTEETIAGSAAILNYAIVQATNPIIAPVAPGNHPRSYGTIQPHTGEPTSPADAIYDIAGTVLDKAESTTFKRWIWQRMQCDVNAVAALYEIVDYAYIGVDVYVSGRNAEAIAAAATYELKEFVKRKGKSE